MIRVYDDAGNVIETHERKGDFQRVTPSLARHYGLVLRCGMAALDWSVVLELARCRRVASSFERISSRRSGVMATPTLTVVDWLWGSGLSP